MAEKKKYKVDLFGKLLPALDRRDFDIYNKLTEEEQKGFADIVVLRAMSSTKTNDRETLEYLLMVTNGANKHLWNSALKDHTELKCMILATIGLGNRVDHEYIKAPVGKKQKTIIMDILKRFNPTASINELQMFIDINEEDDIIEVGELLGMQKEELKEYKKEVRKIKNGR